MPRSCTLLTLRLVGVGLVAALLIARSWRFELVASAAEAEMPIVWT